jgi:hypothetical protein
MRKRRIKVLNNKYINACHIKLIKEYGDFMYPLRCLRVTPGVRVPLVEYHCPRRYNSN